MVRLIAQQNLVSQCAHNDIKYQGCEQVRFDTERQKTETLPHLFLVKQIFCFVFVLR